MHGSHPAAHPALIPALCVSPSMCGTVSTVMSSGWPQYLACGGIIWLTNVIAFGLWYWDLDRGGAAARAAGSTRRPAFLFPEMSNPDFVGENWSPAFVDYLHLSFTTATAFSPTDVSPLKPWAKVMMMSEETISLALGILVVARAVNILT